MTFPLLTANLPVMKCGGGKLKATFFEQLECGIRWHFVRQQIAVELHKANFFDFDPRKSTDRDNQNVDVVTKGGIQAGIRGVPVVEEDGARDRRYVNA